MNTTTYGIEFLVENGTEKVFPEVKYHLENKIKKYNFKPGQIVNFTQVADINENKIQVPRNMDILYGLEITGNLQVGEQMYEKPEDQVKSINLHIGGQEIMKIYLQNKMCDIIVRDNSYSIIIKMDQLFYNVGFLPISNLMYHNIDFIIDGIFQNYQCFLHCSNLDTNIGGEIFYSRHDILFKYSYKYNGKMPKNKIYIKYDDNNLMNKTNFINSLYFKFDKNICDILNYIIIKTDNERLITIVSNNDLKYLGPNEFIIEHFHYKTFLYNNIILEFDMKKQINNTCFELITTNYNSLIIMNGLGAKKFIKFSITISGMLKQYDDFIKMTEKMYKEKVLPKNDLICAISYEDFLENEERIISGCCFSSFKKNVIMSWFNHIHKKICPMCRNEKNIWYIKNS